MTEPLKLQYNEALISKLAHELHSSYRGFNKSLFIADVFDSEWPNRELKQRMRHITLMLNKHLPLTYAEQIKHLKQVAPAFNGFTAMLFPDFVEVFGIEAPDVSIPALEFFTPFSSSEFAVRPFILRYEKRMLKQHLKWASHPNHHVRRLASEGVRPRLPWAIALTAFKKNPDPIFAILEKQMNDESEYVRRSVANCLNDISKDHPEKVLDFAKEWIDTSEHSNRILKHACRGLLKQGHPETLSLFGLNQRVRVSVSPLRIKDDRIKLGQKNTFTTEVELLEKKKHTLRLEYNVYYNKANGKLAAKIFQLGNKLVQPNERITLTKSHNFTDLTTRKHYAGTHRIVLVVNGNEQPGGVEFELTT